MARILIHLPLNISRTLEEMLKSAGQAMGKKNGLQVEVVRNPSQSDTAAGENEKAADIPDMVIGHIDYFSKRSDRFLETNFQSLPGRFPMRSELASPGFGDDRGYFHPFTIIPFAIFANPEMLSDGDCPHVWEDLADICWKGKIVIPDEQHMATKMIRAFMKTEYPEKYDQFRANLVNEGGPLNVVNAVDESRYPLGITNITFARISGNKKIRLLWPEDGFFCMPQIMAFRKGADERLLEIGDFLMSQEVQDYLALQTFVPVSPKVAIPEILLAHDFSLRWKSWPAFLQAINN
ncbi:MAG: ABC transporter substrate-binding protein [Acetobacterium sp.]|nr:ABC transporter substrate-binding protein [Acetobacterium sp.]